MRKSLKITLLAMGLFVFSLADAQQNATLYNMRSMYQRTYVNPGLLPDAKVYIGIPVLGSQYINLSNNRLDFKALNSVLEVQPNDSVFVNVSKLASIFGKRNYLNLAWDMDILHLGIKAGNNILAFNSTMRTMTKVSYPGDLFKIALEGNGGENLDKDMDFSMGLDMQQYLEFGFYYGREHSEKLTFGGRLKYLQGISNVWLEKGDITFRTNSEDFSLNVMTDLKLHTSATFVDPSFIDSAQGLTTNFPKGLLGFKNNGVGLDLGAQYYLTKRIAVSASLIDLGFIRWNSNATTFTSKHPGQWTTFNGVNFNDFFIDSSNFENSVQEMADSLADRLNVQQSRGAYTRSLYTQFYLGSNFRLTKSHNAGLLLYGNFHNRRLHPGLTVSWNSKLTRVFSVSVTYTMVNNTFNNLGLGYTLNGGPFQIHMISDNIINAFSLGNARLMNMRFGMGFTIGRDKDEKD
jgi:hypothetical protein